MKAICHAALFMYLALNLCVTEAADSSWKITQPVWTDVHETQFGLFVTHLATAVKNHQCSTVANCFLSPANIYFGNDPSGLRFYADCADFPYYLRAYFAWKNGLPFSFEKTLQARSPAPGKTVTDIRYSPAGNLVVKRADFVTKGGPAGPQYPNAVKILNETFSSFISTATYRMSGLLEGENFSDFYPAKINRQAIRPGTVIYDPNGHTAIIYQVSEEGRVFYIDAHPDNSITTGMFTPKFARSQPDMGAGFKNFRPLSLVGAKKGSSGIYMGGKIVGALNADLPLFGTEQFYGTTPHPTSWSKGTFQINGLFVDYYDFVRLSLTLGNQTLNPLEDLKNLVSDICTSLKDRVAAVDAARTAGIQNKPHPQRLPLNIYGADGEWETYASPSRDARLKAAFVDLLNQAKQSLEKYRSGDASIYYQGQNLAKDLFQVYALEATSCQFSYFTSNGKKVLLNLEAARQRLFAMSFDPYHCVELRWGARIAQEQASCSDDSEKIEWYRQEQRLRNQTERRYDVRMDYELGNLKSAPSGVGIESPPNTDIVSFLKSQM